MYQIKIVKIMKTIKRILGISVLLMSLLVSNEMQGQKRSSNRSVKSERKIADNRIGQNQRGNDRCRVQPIRRNPHYRYSNNRRVIRTLPRHHVRIVYRGLPYFYFSGIYYTTFGDEYIVVMPPRGFRVSVLPVGHVRIVVGPSVYFYHSGVYYLETTEVVSNGEKYEVTNPPVGIEIANISEDAEEVYIDGKVFYEFNDVIYKEIINDDGNLAYEVVFSKNNN